MLQLRMNTKNFKIMDGAQSHIRGPGKIGKTYNKTCKSALREDSRCTGLRIVEEYPSHVVSM